MAVVSATALIALHLHAAEVRTDAFRIDLPGGFQPFEKRTDTQKTADGEVVTSAWIAKSSTGEALIISESKMRGKILDPDKLFDKTRDALLASLKGTIEADEKSSASASARRLLFKTPGAFIRARLMADGNRLFQILYVARSSEQRQAPAVSALFSSFQPDAAAHTLSASTAK